MLISVIDYLDKPEAANKEIREALHCDDPVLLDFDGVETLSANWIFEAFSGIYENYPPHYVRDHINWTTHYTGVAEYIFDLWMYCQKYFKQTVSMKQWAGALEQQRRIELSKPLPKAVQIEIRVFKRGANQPILHDGFTCTSLQDIIDKVAWQKRHHERRGFHIQWSLA